MNDIRSNVCQQLAAQLLEFIDGELDATLCTKIEQHLADCAACHIVFDTLNKTITLYRHAPREPVPPNWRKRILDFQISEVNELMQTKIAIATEDGVHVSGHFGRAPYFQVMTIEDGKIVARERRDKAHHQGGHHHDEHNPAGQDTHARGMVGVVRDCAVIIAGGMGRPAYASIQAANIMPILTDVRDIEQAAQAYANHTLANRIERVH